MVGMPLHRFNACRHCIQFPITLDFLEFVYQGAANPFGLGKSQMLRNRPAGVGQFIRQFNR